MELFIAPALILTGMMAIIVSAVILKIYPRPKFVKATSVSGFVLGAALAAFGFLFTLLFKHHAYETTNGLLAAYGSTFAWIVALALSVSAREKNPWQDFQR